MDATDLDVSFLLDKIRSTEDLDKETLEDVVSVLIKKLGEMGEKLYYFIILDEQVNHKQLLDQVTDMKQLLQATRIKLQEI